LQAIGGVAILAACQATPPAAQLPSPSAPPTSSEIASSPVHDGGASGPRTLPVPTPSLPVSTVAFSCRLPVLTVDPTYATFRGAFVTFPGLSYQEDPNGIVEGIGDGDLGTRARPILQGPGYPGPFYDLAMKRWLPVGPGQTSPDGRSYAAAYPSLGGAGGDFVDIITVATGGRRAVKATPPTDSFWRVLDFDGRYAYMLAVFYGAGKSPLGVWRLDSSTGRLVRLANLASVVSLRAPIVWLGRNNPADISPPKASRGPLFDSLVALNLTTGVTTTWIYRPRQSITLLGLDASGLPVVNVSSGPGFFEATGNVLRLASPGDPGTRISSGGVALSHMQADGGRIWFGTDKGIYLWTQDGGLKPVFAFQSIWPAGRCV
jgi:hypothetical protein